MDDIPAHVRGSNKLQVKYDDNSIKVIDTRDIKENDKVQLNPKYDRSYKDDRIIGKVFTVADSFINTKIGYAILYFKEKPNQPFVNYHFDKVTN
jgi:hypothetical protein